MLTSHRLIVFLLFCAFSTQAQIPDRSACTLSVSGPTCVGRGDTLTYTVKGYQNERWHWSLPGGMMQIGQSDCGDTIEVIVTHNVSDKFVNSKLYCYCMLHDTVTHYQVSARTDRLFMMVNLRMALPNQEVVIADTVRKLQLSVSRQESGYRFKWSTDNANWYFTNGSDTANQTRNGFYAVLNIDDLEGKIWLETAGGCDGPIVNTVTIKRKLNR